MVTTASKFFFGAAAVALAAAVAYGLGTEGDVVGVLTLGLRGPVGDVAGYTVLIAVGVLLACLGTASSILRDADPEVQASVARLESLPPVVAPATTSYWPVLGALGAVVAAIGLVASPVLFVIGLLGVGIVLLEWMVSAWAERATGDADVNRQIRNRLMYPIEIPVYGALGAVVAVACISRVLLAVSRIGSSVVAIVVAALILLLAFVVAYRPRLSKDLVAGLLVVVALAVVAGGIVGAASGTREFEPHEAEHEDEPGAGGTEGGTADETDAGGGPDAGAEDDPPQDDPGNDGSEDQQDTESPSSAGEQEQEPIAEGTDEGQDQGDDDAADAEEETGLAPIAGGGEG
jgi:hypothetical protein